MTDRTSGENNSSSSDLTYQFVKIGGGVLLFLFVFYLSFHLKMENAPDEYMRYDIPRWILNHGKLPVGDEPELRNPTWGFSYGFSPYLPSMISVLFMAVVSCFTTDEAALVVAARFVSVCSCTAMWFVCCAIGERLLKKRSSAISFASLCCMLPQYIFVSSYLNNDAFGVMICTVVFYLWVRGDQDGWSIKNCVLLAAALSALVLTYYFDYAFVLCSVIFFFTSIHKQQFSKGQVRQRTELIVGIVLIFAGWFFIRNAVLHEGDFLGHQTMLELGEQYAEDPYKPSHFQTMAEQGISFKEAFINTGWFLTSIISFIGVFGYMSVVMSPRAYLTYGSVILVLLLLFAAQYFVRKKKPTILFWCLLLCALIPIGLSMYYSYYSDFQPQGRYFLSALSPVMFVSAFGADYWTDRWQRRFPPARYLPVLLSGFAFSFGIYAVVGYLIPRCC